MSEQTELSWADESKARHWIDRYASGLDGDPQMDRILDCVAAPLVQPTPAEAVTVKALREALNDIRDAANSFCDESGDEVAGQVRMRVDRALAALVTRPDAQPDSTGGDDA